GELEGDPAEHRRDRSALEVHRRPEAADPWQRVGEVNVELRLELRLLTIVQDRHQERSHRLDGEGLGLQWEQLPMDPQQGRAGRLEMQIRSSLPHHELQKVVNLHTRQIWVPSGAASNDLSRAGIASGASGWVARGVPRSEERR